MADRGGRDNRPLGSVFGTGKPDTFNDRFNAVYPEYPVNAISPGNFHPDLPPNHPLRNIRLAQALG